MDGLMNDIAAEHRIDSVQALEAIYGAPSDRALIKEIDYISDHYRAFIEKAPFVVVGSCGPEGLDCSPRGDPPGFVRVHDQKTVLMPDRRGNNRVDTLRNLVRDPRVSLLFMIPGVGETLRINGQANLLTEPGLLQSFEMQGKLPRCIVAVRVDRIYFQCQKALARSRLWDPSAQIQRSSLPSTGTMLQELSKGRFNGKEYDEGYPAYMKETIY